MTDLTERERQIVAWVEDRALALPTPEGWRGVLWARANPYRAGKIYGRFFEAIDIATAIERGEPWGEQA